ncbi:MAG: flagellar biosynthesis protein FliQ [Desulfobacca sp.]|nr:flagellar biosynthesis protein FliQ [Desulfobacca sp.]
MTQELVMGIATDAIRITLIISLPILGIGLTVGILISLIQSATQIQEMTLTFIPKICAVFVGLLLFLPWIMNQLISYTITLYNNIPRYIQ